MVHLWYLALTKLRYWVLALGITTLGALAAMGIQHLLSLNCQETVPCIVTLDSLLRAFSPLQVLTVIMLAMLVTLLETDACLLIGMAAAPMLLPRWLSVAWGLIIRILPVYLITLAAPSFNEVDFTYYYYYYPHVDLMRVGVWELTDLLQGTFGFDAEPQRTVFVILQLVLVLGVYSLFSYLVSLGMIYLRVSDDLS